MLAHYFFLRFYLFEKEREWAKEGAQAGEEAEEEADSLLNKEPDVGLDPRTLESWPEPKADT